MGGVASVLIIYSLVLLVRNRYYSSTSSGKQNRDQNEEGNRILCLHCQGSNLNCQKIYNKLYATTTAKPTTTTDGGKCFKCGNDLVQGGPHFNGKVSAPESRVVERKSPPGDNLAQQKLDKGTGAVFDPETVSTVSACMEEQEEEEEQFPRGRLEPQLSEQSTVVSMQTVLEVPRQQVAAGETTERPTTSGHKWTKAAGRVLGARRVVDILKRAVVSSGRKFSSRNTADELYFDCGQPEWSPSSSSSSPEPEFLSSNRLRRADIQM